jgi:hypothetical protein
MAVGGFYPEFTSTMYAGLAILITASVWNTWLATHLIVSFPSSLLVGASSFK